MKIINNPPTSPLIRRIAIFLALLVMSFTGLVAKAHPYASGISGTNGAGAVSFIMNEAGATVDVVFEDNTTNHLGVLPKGSSNFNLGTHTSFRIICFKAGNGVPSIISSDAVGVYTYSNSVWNSPRGVAINKNPVKGSLFGRIYVGNNATGAQSSGPKGVGLYALNADQTYVTGPKAPTGFAWSGALQGNFGGPDRLRVNDDSTVLATDGDQGAPNILYQFQPDLSSSTVVLGKSSGGPAGDLFGAPKFVGSLAAGNLVLYTASTGIGAPSDTNCIKGPLTGSGSFNCIYRYNIGAGPLPWTKRPDYAYTVGLDGIANLRPELDVEADGKVIAGFGRANASNPNLQILRPFPTTNGITGDLFNKAVQDAARDATNWLYTGGVTPPFNVPPAGSAADPWVGLNGSGTAGGTYAGVRVSPDGQYIASVDVNNGVTIANLVDGIPNEGTIFGINQSSFPYTAPAGITGVGASTANSRGMDWDIADNIWVVSSGNALLRCFSLGLTTTCVSSNDWTGTNGTFQLVTPPIQASVTVVNGTASQNYTNNTVNPGAPRPGVFRITLNATDTTAFGTTTIGFSRTGTGGIIGGINVTAGGTNYTTAPAVTFTGGGGSGAAAVAAVSGGKVTSVTVTLPGAGYTANPTIGFTGGGGGSNATATVIRGLDFGQYTLNTNETPNGVTITPNAVIFPAGVFSGSNGPNWNVDVKVIPTAFPISGPTYVFNVRLLGGTNYSAVNPLSGSIAILNTGPQLLQLSAAAPSTLGGMSRGIPHDQARFVITRLGDTNGPNNDALNTVVARPLTLTAINYFPPAGGSNFMAKPGVDFTAQAQKFTGPLPVDGAPGIVINPGEVSVTGMIGNPVQHSDTSLISTNLTVIINLTNICNTTGSPGCNTNGFSGEGYPYRVTTTGLTLSEFDNAVGGEVLLWSNPLTNSFDSTNWTLVFGSINQGASPTLPTIISNYDNSANFNGNSYYASFGKSVNDPASDGGVTVPQSTAMIANNWTTALKVAVNKNPGNAGESGINLYPQIPGAPWTGSNFIVFQGNYALRFDMYLSLYDFGLNNGAIGTPAREFAAFGINHYGTNANWRLDVNPRGDGTGSRPINADGEWCAIGAASGAITPADYDMFISPAFVAYDANGAPIPQIIPFTTNVFVGAPLTNAFQFSPGVYSGVTNIFANNGVPNDQQSANNNSFGGAAQNGIIKNPPFSGINNFGGAPDNAWVDVSLELKRQTNLTLLVARQPIFSSAITPIPFAGTANPIAPFSGTPMLGYLDPNIDISDFSAFVYYSNIRLVELSPFIPWTNQPATLIVTQGTTFTLSSGATFASNPLTNVWYLGTTNGPNVLGSRDNGTPTAAIITNIFTDTNGLSSIIIPNVQSPTNYIATWSDAAGSVTSFVACIEVITGPGDKTDILGGTTTFTVVPLGNAPPSSYQWMFYGTNLVNSAKYAGATAASLTINNVSLADAGVYSNLVANAFGSSVVVAGTLTVNVDGVPPYQFTTITNSATSVGLAFTTANPGDVPASFTLQSAGVVTGPYTNNLTGVFSGANPNFVVTVPKTNAMMYYRLKHN